MQELLRLELPVDGIHEQQVDRAFEEIISARNDNHFAHYHSRLKSQFKGQELKYALEMLRILSKDGVISRSQLLDQAYAFDVVDQFRKIIEILVYDGYINNVGDKEIYRFNSPVVRLWWNKYIY